MGHADHNLIIMGDTSGTRWGTAGAYNRDNTIPYLVYADAFYWSYANIGHNFPVP